MTLLDGLVDVKSLALENHGGNNDKVADFQTSSKHHSTLSTTP